MHHTLVEDSDVIEREPEEFLDCVDNMEEVTQKLVSDRETFVISLHALWETEGC